MENEEKDKPEKFVSDFSTCRKCQTIKLRKFIGTFDGKNKKYTDEDGKLWSGRHCPSCHRNLVMLNLRRKRAEPSNDT